ncbi:enoyl-(Acyl carrier protein) reductase domain-containing protein [Ditylenchus destructor]|nr:enoyl-(Acyl carrier protein) reductase domain-containing protein [Ditylenchus destructor]
MSGRFQDKVVIVTGSSSGIGRAALLEFAKEGANVVLHGFDKARLAEAETQLKSIVGGNQKRYLIVTGLIQDETTVQALINETLKKWGRLDVLVNNAGLGYKPGTDILSTENYDYIFDINVRARIRLLELAIPHLQKTKGNVVGVSSTSGFKKAIEHPIHTFYGMASASFDAYIKYDAPRLATFGIRINNVNPGPTNANIFRHGATNQTELDAGLSVYEALTRNALFKGHAEPDEVSRVILFLADERSKSIHGSLYLIDRGLACSAPP